MYSILYQTVFELLSQKKIEIFLYICNIRPKYDYSLPKIIDWFLKTYCGEKLNFEK